MNETRIYRIFVWSVLLKGAHSLIECLGGIALLFLSTESIAHVVDLLTQEELIEDPHDLIATKLLEFANTLSVSTERFYAFYLLSHGLVKLALVIGLLKNKLWAYPASLIALALFIAYQLYRYSYTHSLGLILLTILDLTVIWLVWHEYRRAREISGRTI